MGSTFNMKVAKRKYLILLPFSLDIQSFFDV